MGIKIKSDFIIIIRPLSIDINLDVKCAKIAIYNLAVQMPTILFY